MFKIEMIQSNLEAIKEIIKSHIDSLPYPMDSWLEDRLLESVIYKLMYEDRCIGYAGIIKETLQFFHVLREYFRYAPDLLERIVSEKSIKRVFVMTQDSLSSALLIEWDFNKEKQACWFTDSGRLEKTPELKNVVFKVAVDNDILRIRKVCGDFFDEASGGFSSLEERIAAGTIFVLEHNEDLWGCGIVEKGLFCTNHVSIGMYTNPQYRKKGVAKTILLNLKEWAYKNKLKPVAGCWYYNTLSRKSLESAGMIMTSIGYEAVLKGKEKLPLRTGNPPGELVEEKDE